MPSWPDGCLPIAGGTFSNGGNLIAHGSMINAERGGYVPVRLPGLAHGEHGRIARYIFRPTFR